MYKPSKFPALIVFFLVLLISVVSWAQEVVEEVIPAAPSTEEVVGIITSLVAAAKGGQWALVAALGIMVVIWALKTFFWKSLPPKAMPWVSAAAGVLLSFAATLQGGASWLQAAIAGLFTGAAASGFWSLVGKHLLPSKKEEPAPKEGTNTVVDG